MGFAAAPVGVVLSVTGVYAGVDGAFVGVEAGVGPGVGFSDESVGTGVSGSGVGELAGNGVVAAPDLLCPQVRARRAAGLSGSGLSGDVGVVSACERRRGFAYVAWSKESGASCNAPG